MRILIVLLYIYIIPCNVNAQENTEVLNIAIGEIYRSSVVKNSGADLERALKAIYTLAGINVKFIYLPDERAISSTESGKFDALDLRIDNLSNETHLIKIPVPLAYMDIYLFNTKENFFTDLSQLGDKVVVSRLGTRYIDQLTKYKNLYLVNSSLQGAMMLSKGRADVWLTSKVEFEGLKDEFPEIKFASPLISQEPLYHYIHISHSHLLPRLEAAARKFIDNRNVTQTPNSQ